MGSARPTAAGVASAVACARERDRRRALAAPRGPLARPGGRRRVSRGRHSSGARRLRGRRGAGAASGAAAAGASADLDHARQLSGTPSPRGSLAGSALRRPYAEKAARVHDRGCRDACARHRVERRHLLGGRRGAAPAAALSERRAAGRLVPLDSCRLRGTTFPSSACRAPSTATFSAGSRHLRTSPPSTSAAAT